MRRRLRLCGMPDDPLDRGADRLPNRAYWWRGTGLADRALLRELMPLRRRLAALFVVLALTGCAQGVTDNRSYAPYSPENNGNMHDSGGGGGGGGGGSM